ncbi:arabinanase [Coleophoma cylindrospora]|uniref:Arabinanase n=1 Tax=Coleophoma cylindrospora TaxID=1849047 RepID=A0A3D8SG69_9HELO|nr:arabinanase [Coleophoma cylindrospora]
MKIIGLVSILCAVGAVAAIPTQSLHFGSIAARANTTSLVGYLGVFFLGNDPNIYFYLSNGNDAISFSALNGGNPILVPTLGTGGVRDPSIVSAGGADSGKKWYITTWDASQRNGSLSIFIWESTDLINWGTERLVQVENDDAGMVWAPDAIWDANKGQYLVHWASRFYPANDTNHTGTSGADMIRYAYTSDFVTFSTPQTFIDYSPTSVIDLCILSLGNGSYARFMKNETATNVFMERSDSGLFGTWTRPGGATAIVRSSVEGPYAYMDNLVAGNVTLILDYFNGDGYHPFTSNDLNVDDWADANRTNFPVGLRHGSVLSVTQDQYDALSAMWG